jgi:tRNA-dihydrouridine synthase B
LRGDPIPPDPTPDEERKLLLHHFQLVCQRFGDERGTSLMRKFACCYAQGRHGARDFRASVGRVSTPPEFYDAVERFFPRELITI